MDNHRFPRHLLVGLALTISVQATLQGCQGRKTSSSGPLPVVTPSPPPGGWEEDKNFYDAAKDECKTPDGVLLNYSKLHNADGSGFEGGKAGIALSCNNNRHYETVRALSEKYPKGLISPGRYDVGAQRNQPTEETAENEAQQQARKWTYDQAMKEACDAGRQYREDVDLHGMKPSQARYEAQEYSKYLAENSPAPQKALYDKINQGLWMDSCF